MKPRIGGRLISGVSKGWYELRAQYPKTLSKSTIFKRFDRWRADRLIGNPWTAARSLAVDRLLDKIERAGGLDREGGRQ